MTDLAKLLAAAVLALLGKIVWDWLSDKKKSGESENGHSGQKPVSYWERQFDHIEQRVGAAERNIIAAVEQIMRDRKDTLTVLLRQVLEDYFKGKGGRR